MSGYAHDVFLSSKNKFPLSHWIQRDFLPLFRGYLADDIVAACGRPSDGVFHSETSIPPGSTWPDELANAIRRSRVCVALCSPQYFLSAWCLAEFSSFQARSRQEGKPLLVPVAVHDGHAFPQDARDLQIANLANFAIVGPGFKETKRYTAFQVELKRLSEQVSAIVAGAPEFKDWPLSPIPANPNMPMIRQQVLST